MEKFDIYLIGVGGQGIGLLSETLARAIDHAGFEVQGVDTHGLAQRGGVVESYIRIGPSHSPLIKQGEADMVIGLEINEALRGTNNFLRDGGTLLYAPTEWQPLAVRIKEDRQDVSAALAAVCKERKINKIEADQIELEDSRMENVVLLAVLARERLIPGLKKGHFTLALQDLLTGSVLEKNLEIFLQVFGE